MKRRCASKCLITRTSSLSASSSLTTCSPSIGPRMVDGMHQRFCLTLIEQYGNDVGVVFTFFMNIVQPGAGKWFLIDAGVPHAYL